MKGLTEMAKTDVCPGCSKHCAMGAARCKYGRAYFDSIEKKAPEKKRKWERYAASGSTVWLLLHAARKIKKALCHEKISEAQLMDGMSLQEQAALDALVKRMLSVVEE